mmetsp:Transcript_13617/g.35587  ORF Transcript_13617/g.35587 Transcript_13617/m.35587 type:complete len:84 (-) Transcript_13617:53-304(-)
MNILFLKQSSQTKFCLALFRIFWGVPLCISHITTSPFGDLLRARDQGIRCCHVALNDILHTFSTEWLLQIFVHAFVVASNVKI